MRLVPIQIECQPGSQTEETPLRLCVKERWLDVMEICDRWYEKGTDPEWPETDHFKGLASEDHACHIKRDLECDEGFSCAAGKPRQGRDMGSGTPWTNGRGAKHHDSHP
ncbi:MAG: hypothetical protein PHQ04_05980 [Opitutaceae bacterium]|nr:hypothetical protein [Opitutaceae bacterium]